MYDSRYFNSLNNIGYTTNSGTSASTLNLTLNYSPYSKPVPLSIHKVIFNDPCTIILWSDKTKTIVKCGEDEEYDPEKGMAMAISKKFLGNKGNYYETFKKWLPEEKGPTIEFGASFKNAMADLKETMRNFYMSED